MKNRIWILYAFEGVLWTAIAVMTGLAFYEAFMYLRGA